MKRVGWLLATWFGCGLVPLAPGTVGTLGALPLYWWLRTRWGSWAVALAAIALTFVGVWAAGVVADAKKTKDPQIVVIDEVAGVLFALVVAPASVAGVLSAVVAFRIFDTWKPYPARAAESLLRGWGIVLDDVVAGFQAAAVVVVLRFAGALP